MREDTCNFLPPFGVVGVFQIENTGMGSLVSLDGFDTAVIDCKLLKVSKNTEGKLGAPGVTAQLIGRVGIPLDID